MKLNDSENACQFPKFVRDLLVVTNACYSYTLPGCPLCVYTELLYTYPKAVKSGPTLYLEGFSFPFCSVIGISLCFLVFYLSFDLLKAQITLRRKQTLVRFWQFYIFL